MAAEAPPPRPSWQVQAMEEREKDRMISLLLERRRDLSLSIEELSRDDMSDDAEREAKVAQLRAERRALMEEVYRLDAEKRTPDYSGMTEAERAAEAERLRQEVLQEARRLHREGDPVNALLKERQASIIDFDPKQHGMYFNRPLCVPHALNHDEESPLGPMRFSKQVYENGKVPDYVESVNILSVKIACSDVGFPIQVYGSVLARDSIDSKCVYLFRCDRDHCQLIRSKDESLILTGPKRGLAVVDDIFVEVDLMIKDHQGQDRQLSKGLETIGGITRRSLDKCVVETESIATRLSTVDVKYAFVIRAVEATVMSVRVVKGEFCGTITAHTTSVQDRIEVYDSSKVAGGANTTTRARDGRRGDIQLMRPVVSVYKRDKLIIEAKAKTGESARLEFTPRANYGKREEMILGDTKLRLVVAWSTME